MEICKLARVFNKIDKQIQKMKDILDDKIHQKSGRGEKMWLSSTAGEEEEELESVVDRVGKWSWSLRPMDMFNVDLSVIPTVRLHYFAQILLKMCNIYLCCR